MESPNHPDYYTKGPYSICDGRWDRGTGFWEGYEVWKDVDEHQCTPLLIAFFPCVDFSDEKTLSMAKSLVNSLTD